MKACCDAAGAVMDSAAKPIGHAIGRIASPTVESIHWDAVISEIDLNAALDKVDWDRHLDKVDFDRILARISVNDLIARSDLGAVIAQSTTGVFGNVLDALRTQLVLVDFALFRIARFRWHLGGRTRLPPKPSGCGRAILVGGVDDDGERQEEEAAFLEEEAEEQEQVPPHYPPGRTAKAVAVQGRYTGFFSKAFAIFIDVALVTLIFAVLMIILQLCLILFQGTSRADAKEMVDRSNFWVVPFYCFFWWLWFYLSVALVGQTLGMSIAGIKVVPAKRGMELSACQAAMRTTLLPLSLTLMPFLGAVGFFRKDGRMLHDIVSGTGIIYRWDARMAELRAKAEERVEAAERQNLAEEASATTSLLASSTLNETCRSYD